MTTAMLVLVALLGVTFVVATLVVLYAMWRLMDARAATKPEPPAQKDEGHGLETFPARPMISFLDAETRSMLYKVGSVRVIHDHYPTFHSGWDFCGECTKRGKVPKDTGL